MYCPKCGKDISENSRFCQECGYSVENIENKERIEKILLISGPILVLLSLALPYVMISAVVFSRSIYGYEMDIAILVIFIGIMGILPYITNKVNKKIMMFSGIIGIFLPFLILYISKSTVEENIKGVDIFGISVSTLINIEPGAGLIVLGLGSIITTYFGYRMTRHNSAIIPDSEAKNNENADKWYNKGVDLGERGQYDDAIKAYNNALRIRPDHPDARFNLACIFSLKGDKETALSNLKRAIEIDKANKEHAKTEKDFEKFWTDEDFKKLID